MSKRTLLVHFRNTIACVCLLWTFTAISYGQQQPWTAPDAQQNINNTNTGNVGIGTSTPSEALHISNNRVVGQIQLQGGTNNAGFIGYWDQGGLFLSANRNVRTNNNYNVTVPGAFMALGTRESTGVTGDIWFATTSAGTTPTWTELLRIKASGNVGIGKPTPGFKLDVAGEINATGFRINGTPISLGSSQWTTTGSNIYFSTGSVGIGSNAPGAKLDVIGTIRGGNANTNIGNHPTYGTGYAAFWRQGADYSLMSDGSNTFVNAPVSTGNIYFRRANADNMVLVGASGNLGIGTASPTSKLHVVGNGNITGDLTVGGNLAAKYQDVAEWVDSSQQLSAGTVVSLDTSKSNQVIASTHGYDTRVAGVISLQPGLTLGEKGEGRVLVATTGRVKVKVDASRGPIQIGDLLVTSDKEGYAMKSLTIEVGGVRLHRPGTLIGKALEPLASGTGEILVLLSLQ